MSAKFTAVKADPSQPSPFKLKSCPIDQTHTLELSSSYGVLANDTNNPYIVMLIRNDSDIQVMWGQLPNTSFSVPSGYKLAIKAVDGGNVFWSNDNAGDYTYSYNWSSTVQGGQTFYFSKMSY